MISFITIIKNKKKNEDQKRRTARWCTKSTVKIPCLIAGQSNSFKLMGPFVAQLIVISTSFNLPFPAGEMFLFVRLLSTGFADKARYFYRAAIICLYLFQILQCQRFTLSKIHFICHAYVSDSVPLILHHIDSRKKRERRSLKNIYVFSVRDWHVTANIKIQPPTSKLSRSALPIERAFLIELRAARTTDRRAYRASFRAAARFGGITRRRSLRVDSFTKPRASVRAPRRLGRASLPLRDSRRGSTLVNARYHSRQSRVVGRVARYCFTLNIKSSLVSSLASPDSHVASRLSIYREAHRA